MAATRAKGQASIGFPRKKAARTAGRPKAPQASSSSSSPAPPITNPDGPKSPPPLQPLSPRKRLGDDNLCNIPQSLPCSPPKQSKKENGPPLPVTPKGRRLVFEDQPASRSPGRRDRAAAPSPGQVRARKGQETPRNSERGHPSEREVVCVRLFKQEGSCYQQAKLALNTAVPDRLPAREKEMEVIRRFLKEHVCGKRAGSLYVSGAPGTGKTACLSRVLQDLKGELGGTKVIVLNCMSLRSSQAVFPTIARELFQEGASRPAGRDVVRKLEKHMMAAEAGHMILLVLDEMDQLDSKGQDVLYTLFEWPWLSGSRLVLIGIANALDLTDRILPRLQARAKCRPQLLNFPPYTKDQLTAILQERLGQVPGDRILDNAAVQFCARKVSAVSGDARKALDVCRRAVEIVESDVRSQTLLRPLSERKSPAKASPGPLVPKRVSLCDVSQVIADVYGDRMAAGQTGAADPFPLQQKILVCSLLLLTRQLKVKEVTLGKLYEAYSKVCRKQRVPAIDQSECLCLSGLLEARGIFASKKNKETRLTKVSLKIEEKDVEHALQDKVLIGNILASGLP
ncbi:cell division control protein 6 homolog [Tachyglossus aculeatus]|uniref:cell division control protein 6 homolog n=1 Tax=Tachyglossus aculeatus TaxID=9261 RepID=UPI0018F6ED10|nr:cell division control protein 6 homolog [Tachyglossus aculeatus]